MSFSNIDQVFHHFSDQEIAEIISYSLRKDHGHYGSAIKEISRMTGLDSRAIRNWYEGQNIPSLQNFLVLAKYSPSLVKAFLEISNHGEICRYLKFKKTSHKNAQNTIYGDNYVTINISLPRNILSKLNQRQLWFYGFLQKGLSLKAEDLVNVWDINLRTARRDISDLVDLNLIEFVGASKNGRYISKN